MFVCVYVCMYELAYSSICNIMYVRYGYSSQGGMGWDVLVARMG
jgi:hypothetical protein